MTPQQTLAVLNLYEKHLAEEENLSATCNGHALTASCQLSHAAWMCQEARKFVEAGEMEKAMRWLGFIQGVLWSRAVFTVDEMREHNRGITS